MTSKEELRRLNPEPVKVHKPQKNGHGTALKFDIRLVPVYATTAKGTEFISKVEGGVFLDLAAQAGMTNGNATFDWNTTITAKLGVNDLSALLLGLRYVRVRHDPIPEELRTKGDTAGTTVGLFHKFDNASTAISLTFAKDGSFLRVSKSKELNRTIKLSLVEEFQLERAMLRALDLLQTVGK
jgi:hypothetical protein